jgi:hypothetical protein
VVGNFYVTSEFEESAMPEKAIIEQLLVQLLSNQPPEIGARLKQRLNAAFIANGFGRFNEQLLGYRKFKDFLEQGTSGMINVERQGEKGDVWVSLRENIRGHSESIECSRATARGIGQPQPVVRSDIWQAFCNPDLQRKRFLHKKSVAVRHYMVQQGMPADIGSHLDDYLEIVPISGTTQTTWMREFLEFLSISPSKKATLEAIVKEPYSSSINSTLTHALGTTDGGGWRLFRTKQIHSVICKWAQSHTFPLDKLYTPATSACEVVSPVLVLTTLSVRQKAIRLLELLPDEDIAEFVISPILNAILINTQR